MISRFASYVAIALAACFIFAAGWFCLWSISLHLAGGPALAVLLTLLPLLIARRQQVRNDWQQLLLLLATVTAAALLQALLWHLAGEDGLSALLLPFLKAQAPRTAQAASE